MVSSKSTKRRSSWAISTDLKNGERRCQNGLFSKIPASLSLRIASLERTILKSGTWTQESGDLPVQIPGRFTGVGTYALAGMCLD